MAKKPETETVNWKQLERVRDDLFYAYEALESALASQPGKLEFNLPGRLILLIAELNDLVSLCQETEALNDETNKN